MINERQIDLLDSASARKRLKAVKKLASSLNYENGTGSANLNVHSKYSFSPYTPSMAAFMAHKFGLSVVGILDNYTLKGAQEFGKACEALSIRYVSGVEFCLKCDFLGDLVASVAFLGIAKKNFNALDKDLAFLRDNQFKNVQKTIDAVNKGIEKFGLKISFKKDIASQVACKRNGVYLSKHVCFALSQKLAALDKSRLAEFFSELGIELTENDKKIAFSQNDPYYVYDLTDILYRFRDKFRTEKRYYGYKDVLPIAKKYDALCSFRLTKELSDNYLTSDNDIFTLIQKVKNAGFDVFCYDDGMFSAEINREIIEKCRLAELLPLRLNEIEFPRAKMNKVGEEYVNQALLQSAFSICGSEKCLNTNGKGFLSSQLKIESFEEKVELFARIGKGE